MSTIDHAAQIIADVFRPLVKGHANAMGRDLATKLAAAGLLTPEPRIIRTVKELEALDPDTLVTSRKGYLSHAEDNIRIPAVVVATGEHVRAARQALEATE